MAEELSMDQVFIKKLSEIIEINFENELFGVAELAEELGVSRSQLHRKLHAINGKSASQFIREYRLEKAMEMLQDNVATASEIAYRVGFGSPTYFNTSFHQYYGYPPGEVKFRSSKPLEDEEENQASDQADISNIINKKSIKQTLLLIVALVVILIAAFTYYNYSNSKNVVGAKNNEPIKTVEKTIAVLPLKNWSGDVELEYISDGMTDAIISKLSGIQAIDRVAPFTSILQYKDTDKDISTIAEELGVQYILEGNFKLSGNQMQSNLKLIEVESNKHLWSLEYSGAWASDEIFEMQADVAENIAGKMKVELNALELSNIKTILTTSGEAYQLFLRGEYQYSKLSLDGFVNSRVFYEQAIKLDSSFVDPYIGLSSSFAFSGFVWGEGAVVDFKRQAKKYYLEAIKRSKETNIDYSSDLLWIKMMLDFHFSWDLLSAKENLEIVLNNEMTQINAYTMAANIALKFGRFDDAIELNKRSLEAVPSQPGLYVSIAYCEYLNGNKEGALDILSQNDPMNNDNYFYLIESSKVYYYLGDYRSSKQQVELAKKKFPDRPPMVLWLTAVHDQINENDELVDENLALLQESYSKRTAGSPAWFIALYYCHTKDYDKAFEWLEKSYAHHEVEMMWLKEEPLLRPLRTDPRYIELYDKVGFSKITPITPYVD